MIASPFVPVTIENELTGASAYFEQHQQCAFCQLISQELADGNRVVCSEEKFVAVCAYAGRQPFETWILPTQHQADFRDLTNQQALALAQVLVLVLKKIQHQLPDLAYNLILHTVPFRTGGSKIYHWHFELVPRTTQLAGFEWGTGLFINPLAPETAAKILRETKV